MELQDPVSVVIPCPDTADAQSVTDRVSELLDGTGSEIILVTGRNPPAQRNLGAAEAENDTVFFLDDGSMPDAPFFPRGLAAFAADDVIAVGGPITGCDHDSLRCTMFNGLYRSWFALADAVARYSPVGEPRDADQTDIILANLAFDRETFQEVDGFGERFFPAEETELMSRLSGTGYTVRYDPGFAVSECKTESIPALASRFMRYGAGRARQFRHEDRVEPLYLIPSLFLLYVILLPMLATVSVLSLAPLALYAMIAAGNAGLVAARDRSPGTLLSAFLHPIIHLSYGAGYLRGLLSDRDIPENEMDIHRISC